MISHDLALHRLTVHVERHSFGRAGRVIGHAQLKPFVRLQRLAGTNSDGVSGPKSFDDKKEMPLLQRKLRSMKTNVSSLRPMEHDRVAQARGQSQPKHDAILFPWLKAAGMLRKSHLVIARKFNRFALFTFNQFIAPDC